MRLGIKIIITGFILFAVGVMGIEMTVQNISSESSDLSDVPLWIRLVDGVPVYLVFLGIITTVAGFVIRRKQNTGGMRDMRR